jgi:DNA repair exonuclease SbcCD ATPase subunit
MEVRLKKLEIEGFRSFKERAVLEFPDGDSLILISGKWAGSAASSGSGKSSILEALAFVLDISTASASSLKNWFSKKMYVKATLVADNQIIEVTRDPKLSLSIDGVQYEGLVKGAKEKLQEILGGNQEMVKSITYRKQRKPGKIVNSTDAEIKEFLTNPLGLNEIETAGETFIQQLNKTAQSLELLKRDEANLSSVLPMNFVSDEEASRVQNEYNAALATYNSMKDAGVSSELQAQAQECKVEISKLHELSRGVQFKRNENANIKSNVLSLQAEIQSLENNFCPTCSREWNQAQDLLAQKTTKIDQLISVMRVNVEYVKNAEPMLSNLPNLEQRLQELNQKIGETLAPLESASSALRSAQITLNTIIQKRQNYNNQAQRLSQIQAQIAEHQDSLSVLELTSKLLGRTGFMGSIFDEILSDIEFRTNDMLKKFPNAGHLTVEISSNKLVKTKGTTKKEISVNISRGGIDVNLDDISGGQQSAVELCSDLAAAEAIRSRSGCTLMWTGLDEVMDGLGTEEKEAVVEMIKHRVKGLVLMIEHDDRIKESFDKVIHVEFDGRESHVV